IGAGRWAGVLAIQMPTTSVSVLVRCQYRPQTLIIYSFSVSTFLSVAPTASLAMRCYNRLLYPLVDTLYAERVAPGAKRERIVDASLWESWMPCLGPLRFRGSGAG